jgi:fructoselysine-6-P-deglycase FrlB-like protein
MHNTITGVDLAKNEIQVCITKANKVLTNDAMTPSTFTEWLAKSKPMTIIFEACGTSNHGYQFAVEYGYDAKLISAKFGANIRQN